MPDDIEAAVSHSRKQEVRYSSKKHELCADGAAAVLGRRHRKPSHTAGRQAHAAVTAITASGTKAAGNSKDGRITRSHNQFSSRRAAKGPHDQRAARKPQFNRTPQRHKGRW